jgi:hypothetical protein
VRCAAGPRLLSAPGPAVSKSNQGFRKCVNIHINLPEMIYDSRRPGVHPWYLWDFPIKPGIDLGH